MNAQTSPVAAEALALAATNADILRAVRDTKLGLPTPGDVARACGRETKNIARDVQRLVTQGLIAKPEGGPFALTAAGARALQGLDLAQGQLEPPARATAGMMLLRHDQLRPNPLNPRKRITAEEIAALADAIEATGDVLQNLVVFPADADGVHTLSAGERRWRAVGLLIEQGRWPADRRLRAIERENTSGQTSFIALVENGARQNLALIEEARAYLALVEETGWSARQAALNTGRDVKTVQEMLKVLREAGPEDIEAHEANPRDFTWERLRNSVKKPSEREAEPDQRDIEELTGSAAGAPTGPHAVNGVDYGNATRAAEARRAFGIDPPLPKPNTGNAQPNGRETSTEAPARLTLDEETTLLEVAIKLETEWEEFEGDAARFAKVRRYWLDKTSGDLTAKGLLQFTHQLPDGPHVRLTDAGWDWIKANRRPDFVAAPVEHFSTPWLNIEAAAAEAQEPEAGHAQAEADPTFEDEVRDGDAMDRLVERLRDALDPTHGNDTHWSRKCSEERAALAVRAVQDGRTIDALVWLMALLAADVGDADSLLADAAQGRSPVADETPAGRLHAAGSALRDVLLRAIEPGTREWFAIEAVYSPFSGALNAVEWALAAPAQAEG